nr:hypothetical protein [Tanacetum cinerariifolium]
MASLADKAILSGADNRPPMLEKDMYDSWKSRMELYMLNRQHGRMILKSVKNGPLLWLTVKENRVTRLKKYSELSTKEAIQADLFQKGDDPIDAINHMMSFLTTVVTSRYPPTNNQLRTSSNPHQQATINNERVTIQPIQGRQNYMTAGMSRQYTLGPSGTSRKQRVIVCYNCKGEAHMLKQCTKPKRKRDEAWFKDKVLLIQAQANGQSHYGSDNLVEDNKNVNEFLTTELERYKDQVRSLKEQNNVDKASEARAQSLEIDNLKHILSEHLKEKESLEQKVTLLKNDFQKEESKNIHRELALEKLAKKLNNIMFKRNQSAQTVHMAQQLEPKMYDGSVIQKTNAIVIHDSEETLKLKDESRSKMLQKQKDPMMSEKKVNTKPVDYAALNQLSKDFKTRFVPQTELPAEQAFWSWVTKLVAKNEHLKQTYKQLYDSIKSSCVLSKEQCNDLIKQVNIKSAKNSELNASFQEKVLVITALKDTLSKLKGKPIVNEVVTLHSIDPELLKIDVAPLAPKLRNNRIAHNDYLKHTQKETATLREIVENERLLNPLNTSLDYACKYTKRIQELLIILKQTCPYINDLGTKLMVVTPKKNNKKIRFTEHIPSSGNTPIKTTYFINVVSNIPVLSSTGVNLLTSASGSQRQGNTKNDTIQKT